LWFNKLKRKNMAKVLQLRGGTTSAHSTFTGALREVTVDTDKDTLVVHDGSTAGGFPLARQSSVDLKANSTDVNTALNLKANLASPTFTGTPLAPTAAAGTNTTQIATTAFVRTANSAVGIPTGVICMWSGSTSSIPSGWYLCNGSNNTPNLQDRFVIGAGSGYAVAATGGSKDATAISHTHSFSATTSTGGAHTHTIPLFVDDDEDYDNVSSFFKYPYGNDSVTTYSTSSAGSHSHTLSGTTGSTGSSGTNANLPPYYALAYIMKG
jgi:hypothetical protein